MSAVRKRITTNRPHHLAPASLTSAFTPAQRLLLLNGETEDFEVFQILAVSVIADTWDDLDDVFAFTEHRAANFKGEVLLLLREFPALDELVQNRHLLAIDGQGGDVQASLHHLGAFLVLPGGQI